MLKLLKHDIKDNYLEIVILNGLLILLSLVMLSFQKMNSGFLYAISLSGWGITIFASGFVVLNSIVKSFHKKLFTDYGYLTLTTPVSIDKMLLSKIIVNLLWIICTIVTILASILIFASSLVGESLFSNIVSMIRNSPLAVFKAVLSTLVYILNSIVMLIFVLVLVNLGGMKKHKLLKGLLIYMAVSFVMSISNPFNSTNILLTGINPIVSANADYAINLTISLVWSVIFYFVSRYLITNKLELE